MKLHGKTDLWLMFAGGSNAAFAAVDFAAHLNKSATLEAVLAVACTFFALI